jgi:hypothetical protein
MQAVVIELQELYSTYLSCDYNNVYCIYLGCVPKLAVGLNVF